MGTLDIPRSIIDLARQDKLMGPRVFVTDRRRVALELDGQVVGFVTPHETASGWRAGPIFVLPKYRRRGLVEQFYAEHRDRTWVAFVPTGYTASEKTHKKAGFVRWKGSVHGTWYRREAT